MPRLLRPDHEWRTLLDAWPGATLGPAIEGGTINDLREVNLGGRRTVGRLTTRDGSDLDWEIDVLTHLHQAGVGVPRLVPAADGRLRVGTMVLMEWVDGRLPDGGDADRRRIATALRSVHTVTAGWKVQRPGWRSCSELTTATTSGPVEVAALPPAALARCRHAWARLDRTSACVIHGDPNPTNVRIDGDRVVLLDWDEARIDDPRLDLAVRYVEADLDPVDRLIGAQAGSAWEAAMFWTTSPDYARKRPAEIDDTGRALDDGPQA